MKKKKAGSAYKAKKPPSKGKGNTGPPVCRLCGSAHWGRDPHRFKGKT